jgi:hypothetical protein
MPLLTCNEQGFAKLIAPLKTRGKKIDEKNQLTFSTPQRSNNACKL